jgi:DNA-binding transcriptional LysR family regulator
MFELSQLRCFLAIAEEMHFGRAADRLNMTQPPLSRQLQQLENSLGVDLVERSSRFVQLTAAGKAFLVDARHILRAAEDAQLTVRRVAKGEGGLISLGFIPATSYSLLPKLVAFVSKELPYVQLVLREMVTFDQVEALTNGRIDAGILRLPIDRRGLGAIALSREPFVLAVPESSPLASKKTVTIKDLDRQPFVMYAPIESRYHYDLLSSAFQVAGIQPQFVQYAREIHTMLALVGAGIGIAMVPNVASNLGISNVKIQKIALRPQLFSEMTLVWRKESENPALRIFINGVLPKFLEEQI